MENSELTNKSDDFIGYPTNHLLAVIDERAKAENAARELREAGFEDVQLYRGRSGEHAIDASGTEHGGGEQLVRMVEQMFSNKDSLAEYETSVQRGSSVVAVQVADDERRTQALSILERRGAHTINYFGKTVVETIKP